MGTLPSLCHESCWNQVLQLTWYWNIYPFVAFEFEDISADQVVNVLGLTDAIFVYIVAFQEFMHLGISLLDPQPLGLHTCLQWGLFCFEPFVGLESFPFFPEDVLLYGVGLF